MFIQSSTSLLSASLQYKTIPIVENRLQLVQVLRTTRIRTILLRHCNIFEIASLLQDAHQSRVSIYVNIDHIDGIHPDLAGMRYLAEHMHITGVLSNHPRTLSLSKSFGMETIQRIFAVDSTGLEMALESVDTQSTDLLDISPAIVVPYVSATLKALLPLPFIASGLISTTQQIKEIIRAGALGVTISRPELWL